jgi:ABC-2 type transport system ATP-binding protein
MGTIEVEGLRKTFADGKVVAVDGVDIDVAEGEIYGFLGPNGAGKTTTTRILTTLLRATSGRARVAGYDVATQAHEVRLVIGVALQDAGLDYLATGRELLELQARLHGFKGTEPGARATRMLELVGLSEAADRRVGTYSGGMKRRLDLASALIHGPRVLFLDEPTAGLDPASRQAIWDEVVRMNTEDGITVFLTTQYLEEADRLCGRVAIIDHGRIVAEGPPAELKASIGNEVVTITVVEDMVEPAHKRLAKLTGLADLKVDGNEFTLFVGDGASTTADAIRTLDRGKIAMEKISITEPSLDEVFLRLTGSRLEGDITEDERAEAKR